MTLKDPFQVHFDHGFLKLVKKLESAGVLEVRKHGQCVQTVLLDKDAFLEALRYVFILYAMPSNSGSVSVCGGSRRIATRGGALSLALAECSSDSVEQVLKAAIGSEGDEAYEKGFNALLAIYLDSLTPMKFVWPNTYITDLGRNSHELDIFLRTEHGVYLMIETTRGFDKDADGIDESYSWHFKKAVFRKWLVERVFDVECRLCYLTLKSLMTDQGEPESLPEELAAESEALADGPSQLIERIGQIEGEKGLKILELKMDSSQSLTMSELDTMLRERVLEPLSGLVAEVAG